MNRIISDQSIVEQRIFLVFAPNFCYLIKKLLTSRFRQNSEIDLD